MSAVTPPVGVPPVVVPPRGRAWPAGVLLALACVTGAAYWLRSLDPKPAGPTNGARLFDQVKATVAAKYVDALPDSVLYRKAVAGMVAQLGDPHSVFLPPDRFRRLTERAAGNYGGIGAQVDARDGWPTVLSSFPNTPADSAGIATGDRIVEIDGRSTHGLSTEETIRLVRGEPGTIVKVTVQRTGGDVKHTYALTRREIHLRSVPRATVLRPGVGYVDLNDFSDSASTEVARAVDSLQKAGATSIVLDLRGNPGGLLPQGVAVAQLFLAAGSKIVSLRGRTPDMTTDVAADTGRKFLSVPLVVLVNGGTASAAEIVAGAVQDADRAVLVGSATYGKGSAQSVFPLGAEALKLTTARWFTPLGRSITRAPLVRPESDDDRSPHDSATKRVAFKTPAGRTVFGGDAISPDVVVADTARSAAERVLERALTGKVITFRDAAAATALGFRREVTSIDITVNDAQRAAFRKALVARRLVLDDSVWAAARPVIDRVLGNELVRSALGADALFQRQVSADVVLQRALEIASGTKVPKDVFARAVPAAAGKRAAD